MDKQPDRQWLVQTKGSTTTTAGTGVCRTGSPVWLSSWMRRQDKACTDRLRHQEKSGAGITGNVFVAGDRRDPQVNRPTPAVRLAAGHIVCLFKRVAEMPTMLSRVRLSSGYHARQRASTPNSIFPVRHAFARRMRDAWRLLIALDHSCAGWRQLFGTSQRAGFSTTSQPDKGNGSPDWHTVSVRRQRPPRLRLQRIGSVRASRGRYRRAANSGRTMATLTNATAPAPGTG